MSSYCTAQGMISNLLGYTIREKNIKIRIFCGSDDEDCMPMAKRLYTVTKQAGIDVEFSVQENIRHQFPTEMYTLKELWRNIL